MKDYLHKELNELILQTDMYFAQNIIGTEGAKLKEKIEKAIDNAVKGLDK